ncbi:MAG TPA: DUF2127 domain-containing protein [Candidatus Saccharimonadales bacterium]|nr:DUF2127 domain-containing protein [Candidatus Saccharimonadales bacterium]
MNRFKPTSLLDRLYKIGLLLKGLDGVLELLGGVLLLALSSGTILHLTKDLTGSELGEDPHNFLALHVQHVGHQLALGHNGFAAVFLLVHGGVKVGLVICLLLNKLWAYPVGLLVLGLLLMYQLYQLFVGPSIGMALLSALDVIIIGLIWREWRLRAGDAPKPPGVTPQ